MWIIIAIIIIIMLVYHYYYHTTEQFIDDCIYYGHSGYVYKEPCEFNKKMNIMYR